MRIASEVHEIEVISSDGRTRRVCCALMDIARQWKIVTANLQLL